MSSFANMNFAAPPTTTIPEQMTNLVNGVVSPLQQQQKPQLQQPQQQQFGQSILQPTAQDQFLQQQQQILEQKQQQQHQQQSNSSTFNSNNMNKFTPPLMGSTDSYATSKTATSNGPTHQQSTIVATTSSPSITATQSNYNNFPPHLRPPGMNGPPGSPLANGSGGGSRSSATISANSSRTASPALQQTLFSTTTTTPSTTQTTTIPTQQQNQLQQKFLSSTNANTKKQIDTMFNTVQPPMKFANSSISTATAPTTNTNSSLNDHMQNLDLNRLNGLNATTIPKVNEQEMHSNIGLTNKTTAQPLLPQQQQHQQQQQQRQTNIPQNFQNNFKMAALNTTPLINSGASSTPIVSNQIGINQTQAQAVKSTIPGLQTQKTNVYGTSTSPLFMNSPLDQQQQPPKMPPSQLNQNNSAFPPNNMTSNFPIQQQQSQVKMPPPPTQQQIVSSHFPPNTSGGFSMQTSNQQQPKIPPLSTSQNLNYSPNITNNFPTQPTSIQQQQQQQQQPKMPPPPPASIQNANFATSSTTGFVQQSNIPTKMPPSPLNQNANLAPISTSGLPQQQQQQQQSSQMQMPLPPTSFSQNANYPPSSTASNAFPPHGPPTNAIQQNNLNNNQQQPSIRSQQLSGQRKPMYPTANQQSTPMPYDLQQQQHSPTNYIPHSAPPPTTQYGLFNGQPSTGPLQYQSQPQMLQQQQQQPIMQKTYPSGVQTQYNQQQQSGILNQGYNRLWGQDTIDLMQNRHILTPVTLQPPKIILNHQFQESINCNRNIIRCTIAKIPESSSLLSKSRLPLGILIHPFRDINSLPVIQCPNIVRCRLCRTYINPFVYFVDSKMWKCNLCYRVNELPDDFQFDPATKTYGDVTRRPEVRSSTIEFIAPSEYMLRPPQPAIYLFLFDVSIIAQQSGYLENICETLSKHLDDMPGDMRTQVGFIAYNSQVHFYSLSEGYNQPHEITLIDIDDAFLPRPDNLLVNLKECKELIKDLLVLLPKRFADTHDPGSALGAALQVAYKLMQNSGGRVTVFQTCLPNKGPGSLEPRENPNNRSAKDVAHLNPATDFYKRYALECSGYQIAVDLFLLNQQYSDLATISGISKHSGGCVHHFPLYQKTKVHHVDALKQSFKRYLVRKIGFEAVMRIRCTRGLQVHTFHGNFFVRSTDLLSLPNVNPDAGYGMQISYEETLNDVKTICFQAALLYTNSEGERRIRVHTICLPVTSSLPEVMHAADTEAIVSLLSKMAVDRSLTSNMSDAREAFINATIDVMSAFKIAQNLPPGQTGQLVAPRSLALLPLYTLALLKHPAFRIGTSTRLDDRVFAMDCMKTLPLDQLMRFIYPEFYNIDALFYNTENSNTNVTDEDDDDDDDDVPELARLQLSAEYLDSHSIFLMDCGTSIMIYVGINVPVNILEGALGIKSTAELPDYYYGLPELNSAENQMIKRFIMKLNDDKPYPPIVQIIRDTSTAKPQFIEKLIDDRSESSLSYYEFLQHIRSQVK